MSKNSDSVKVTERPEVSLEQLQAQLKQAEEQLREKDNELTRLTTRVGRSVEAFESDISAIEMERHELAEIISQYPEEYVEEERPHKNYAGGRLTRMVFSPEKSGWDQTMINNYRKYHDLGKKLKQMYETLVAVTLIDDPDVTDTQLNCGVNGKLLGLFYSGENLFESDDAGDPFDDTKKRVQLIPYKHYVAIMSSYKLKFKVRKNTKGVERNVPYKVRPVVEIQMPTQEMLRKHKELQKLSKRRRNLEMV